MGKQEKGNSASTLSERSTEQKHTPGPWRAERALAIGDYAIVDQNKNILAECYEDIRHANEHAVAECQANARLIAAAPDLLEALKEVVALSDRKHDAWDNARSAIAKARGESVSAQDSIEAK